MYLRGGSRPFHNGGRFILETIFLEISRYRDVIQRQITRHGKKKNDNDETGDVLLSLIWFYPYIA